MRNPSRSLVGRLVLWFLVPSFAVLCLATLLVYLRTRDTLRGLLYDRLDAIAMVKQAALNNWVEQLHDSVLLLSRFPDISRQLEQLLDGPSPAREESHTMLAQILELAKQSSPSLEEAFILSNQGGRILVSTEQEQEGQYRIYARYYVEGKKAPFIQEVYPSPVTLKPTLTISAPIVGANGDTRGIFAAHLSLEYLDQHILQRAGLGQSGRVTLVDQHKILVTGQQYGQHGRTESPQSRAIDKVVLGFSGGDLYPNLQGIPVVGSYRWIPRRNLGIIVEIDQTEAFKPARRMAFSILGTGLFFLLVLTGIVYLVARRLAGPVLELTQVAIKVGRGDLESRAPVRTRDEIGTLAQTFNQMIDQLRAHYNDVSLKISELEQAESTQAELIQELESKNAELERFTYTVSHDLKSPLVTIQGFVGLLGKDLAAGDQDRTRADLMNISEAANQMKRLLDDLLELSRVGRMTHPSEGVCMNALAAEAVILVTGELEPKGIQIEIADNLPMVFGDRIHLLELLENLVANAVKFSRQEADPSVEIGVRADDGESVFFVRDNGIGIDPAYHSKIFGLFERLDLQIEGTGVGLAIVHRVVDLHGGRIWVESAGQDQGSTFCFTLNPKDHSLTYEDCM